ncbi:glucose-6-phosphate isomerase family protein [Salibacterium aidingense]|uniref:glucose-6-phosphate isomerase family protein n=1 Tax=Salibacterium aidingense TaxID=384933 RepID=UPI000422447C|nr:glucose-6-phosphate isomerase family protein [Salibacterium aidingense]
MECSKAKVQIDTSTGKLTGEDVSKSTHQLKHLQGIFEDQAAYEAMNPETIVYEVEMHDKETLGTEGGLLFGTSYIYPGKVGKEYFMTKGHFHQKRNRAEYYWGIQGHGVLLFMSETGEVTAEEVLPGSLHYIQGYTAHRLVNIGEDVLAVGACWPSDAGHDYADILERGFSKKVRERNGVPFIE